MSKEDIIEIKNLLNEIITTIDKVLNNSFYINDNELFRVKNIVKNWYQDFQKSNTLTTIDIQDLKYIDLKISDFFDKYIETEPMEHNYTEILAFNIGILKKYWKDEIQKGGTKNVR